MTLRFSVAASEPRRSRPPSKRRREKMKVSSKRRTKQLLSVVLDLIHPDLLLQRINQWKRAGPFLKWTTAAATDVNFTPARFVAAKLPIPVGEHREQLRSSDSRIPARAPSWRFDPSRSQIHHSSHTAIMSKSPTGSPTGSPKGASSGSVISEGGPAVTDLIDPDVQLMIHGEGYKPKPLRSWRRCPLIQASRRAEFRPFSEGMTPEIRHLPEHVRASLNGCKQFQPQQIAEYNRVLRQDGKLVSGVEVLATRARVKPGRLYHKFDSLCALATSKAGRLLLLQHRHLPHVFYTVCYDPAHKLYIDLLNMYERRWFAVSNTYGKELDADSSA